MGIEPRSRNSQFTLIAIRPRTHNLLGGLETAFVAIYNRKSIGIIVIICEKKKLLANSYFTNIIITLFIGILLLLTKLVYWLSVGYLAAKGVLEQQVLATKRVYNATRSVQRNQSHHKSVHENINRHQSVHKNTNRHKSVHTYKNKSQQEL